MRLVDVQRLTGTLEVLLAVLPPHHGTSWTRRIRISGQAGHVQGRETIGRHGSRRERVAESCRQTDAMRRGPPGPPEKQNNKIQQQADVRGLVAWRL